MKQILLILVHLLLMTSTAIGSVIEFTDRDEWEAAVGTFTTIDFVLPPSGTPITDQYRSDEGVHFSGFTFSHATTGYLNDGWGLRGVGGAWVHFDKPQQWLGMDHPGLLLIDVYYKGDLLYTTSAFGGSGEGFFGGVVSARAFDAIYIYKPEPLTNIVGIDDLHFGIPAPGALGVFALAALARRRRRA